MKTQLILLVGSLLPISTIFTQVAVPQSNYLASAAPERGKKVADSYRCVARPTRPAAALRVVLCPRREAFTVQLAEGAPRAGLQLELVNVLGSVVLQRALPAAQFTVPAQGVPGGLYWVRLRGPQGYQAAQRVVLS